MPQAMALDFASEWNGMAWNRACASFHFISLTRRKNEIKNEKGLELELGGSMCVLCVCLTL